MDADQIKSGVDIFQLISHDTTLKKVSSTCGGEWAGPCPMCGGKDRFRVQPYRPGGSKWYCRGCGGGRWHDVIDYIAFRDGLDFQSALATLGNNQIIQQAPQKESQHKNSEKLKELEINRDKWLSTARYFVNLCADNLWEPSSSKALEYLRWRGLLDITLQGWQIGYNPQDAYGDPIAWGLQKNDSIFLPRGVVIPCFSETSLHYIEVRRGSGDPKYHIIKGGQPFLYGAQTYQNNLIAFLFESELDVLLALQTGLRLGYGSFPAGQRLLGEYAPYFKDVEDLVIAFDNDKPGNMAVDKLCRISPKFHKARPLPMGKDLTDYFHTTGNPDDILFWLLAQLDYINDIHGS